MPVEPGTDSVVVAQAQSQPVGTTAFRDAACDPHPGLCRRAPHGARQVGADPGAVAADGVGGQTGRQRPDVGGRQGSGPDGQVVDLARVGPAGVDAAAQPDRTDGLQGNRARAAVPEHSVLPDLLPRPVFHEDIMVPTAAPASRVGLGSRQAGVGTAATGRVEVDHAVGPGQMGEQVARIALGRTAVEAEQGVGRRKAGTPEGPEAHRRPIPGLQEIEGSGGGGLHSHRGSDAPGAQVEGPVTGFARMPAPRSREPGRTDEGAVDVATARVECGATLGHFVEGPVGQKRLAPIVGEVVVSDRCGCGKPARIIVGFLGPVPTRMGVRRHRQQHTGGLGVVQAQGRVFHQSGAIRHIGALWGKPRGEGRGRFGARRWQQRQVFSRRVEAEVRVQRPPDDGPVLSGGEDQQVSATGHDHPGRKAPWLR